MGYATQYAGNLVGLTRVPSASGLSWDQAFAAISSVPARAVGMEGSIGSLRPGRAGDVVIWDNDPLELGSRSEEHTSELQSLMRISYAVFCLKKKNIRYMHENKTNKYNNNRRVTHR